MQERVVTKAAANPSGLDLDQSWETWVKRVQQLHFPQEVPSIGLQHNRDRMYIVIYCINLFLLFWFDNLWDKFYSVVQTAVSLLTNFSQQRGSKSIILLCRLAARKSPDMLHAQHWIPSKLQQMHEKPWCFLYTWFSHLIHFLHCSVSS